jgi:hypothetical protein
MDSMIGAITASVFPDAVGDAIITFSPFNTKGIVRA